MLSELSDYLRITLYNYIKINMKDFKKGKPLNFLISKDNLKVSCGNYNLIIEDQNTMYLFTGYQRISDIKTNPNKYNLKYELDLLLNLFNYKIKYFLALYD